MPGRSPSCWGQVGVGCGQHRRAARGWSRGPRMVLMDGLVRPVYRAVMASHVKRGRPPEEGLAERRREEILRAATCLFAANGFACTDLQDVADKLGVGKGTLYRY